MGRAGKLVWHKWKVNDFTAFLRTRPPSNRVRDTAETQGGDLDGEEGPTSGYRQEVRGGAAVEAGSTRNVSTCQHQHRGSRPGGGGLGSPTGVDPVSPLNDFFG